jgi:hypothetical protein
VRERLPASREPLLAAFALTAAGAGFLSSSGYFRPGLTPSAWRTAAPAALAAVPGDAKVWCDGYLLPNLALRRSVKVLPALLPDRDFEARLFVPDAVVLSAYWIRMSDAAAVRRVLGYLERNRYRPVVRRDDLVVLARADGAHGVPEEPLRLP